MPGASAAYRATALAVLVSAVAACTHTVDLTKEARARGPNCSYDAPSQAMPGSGADDPSPPRTRVQGAVELPPPWRASSVAVGKEGPWVLADEEGTNRHMLLGLTATGGIDHEWRLPGWPWSLQTVDDHAVSIDLRTERLMRVSLATGEVRLDDPMGAGPQALAVSGDGRRAYVVLGLTAEIGVVDLVSGREDCRLPVVSGVSSALALSRDGQRLFVGYGGGGGSSYHAGVEVMDRRTGETLGLAPLGIQVNVLSLSPDESLLLALTGRSDSVDVIDASTLTTTRTIALPGVGEGIAWDREWAYVWSREDRAIWVLDPRAGSVVATVTLPQPPTGVAVDDDSILVAAHDLYILG